MIPAIDDGEVAFFERSRFELTRNGAVGVGAACDEEDEAARVTVEALVHGEVLALEVLFGAKHEVVAALVVMRLHGNTRRLVDDHDGTVVVGDPRGVEKREEFASLRH